MLRVTLLLGSNLGDRHAFLASARERIKQDVGRIVERTSVDRSEPWGYKSENFYANQIVVIESFVDDPIEILDALQSIETSLGRVRTPHATCYVDRTIDIDILYIDGVELSDPRLIVPHPRIGERDFVLSLLAQLGYDKTTQAR